MNTQILVLTVIALAGLGVMMIGFDSEVTGQGVQIRIPKETLQKVAEQNNPPQDMPEIFTTSECVIFREIYWLRKELNLNLNRFDTVVYYCENAKGVKF